MAIQQRPELVLSDLALELEILGAARQPVAGRLTGAGVVILGAAGDGVQVVELTTFAELPYVEDVTTSPFERSSRRVEETSNRVQITLRQHHFLVTSRTMVQVCARRSQIGELPVAIPDLSKARINSY